MPHTAKKYLEFIFNVKRNRNNAISVQFCEVVISNKN